MKNYADLGGCYPPQPSASAGNTLLDPHNSSYHTQPHPIIANKRYLLVDKPKTSATSPEVLQRLTEETAIFKQYLTEKRQ